MTLPLGIVTGPAVVRARLDSPARRWVRPALVATRVAYALSWQRVLLGANSQ